MFEQETKELLTLILEKIKYDPETGELYWKATNTVAGCYDRKYKVIRINRKRIVAHRVCFAIFYKRWPAQRLDHRDNNGYNNKIDNLREATHAQNLANQKSKCNRGVYQLSNGCWLAAITSKYRKTHLGVFATQAEATLAYAKAATDLFGSFAPSLALRAHSQGCDNP